MNVPCQIISQTAEKTAEKNASLGSITEFASKSGLFCGGDAKTQRFILQSVSRDLLPGHRVTSCLRTIAPLHETVDLYYRPATRSAFFKNLMICGNPWVCPLCSARITEQRRKELTIGLARAVKDYEIIMITYTFAHKRTDALLTILKQSKEARRRLKSGRRFNNLKSAYGWIGSVTSTEVTYGDNGWHVHYHEIALLKKSDDPTLLPNLQTTIKALWLSVLAAAGLSADWQHSVNFALAETDVLEYVAKWGHEPLDATWTITHEAVKGISKVAKTAKKGRTPFQLLADCFAGDRASGDLFKAFARAFKGTKQLQWSRGLRKLLQMGVEKSDEELAKVELSQADTFLDSLSREQWHIIQRREQRAALDAVCRTGDVLQVKAWIEHALADVTFVHVSFKGY